MGKLGQEGPWGTEAAVDGRSHDPHVHTDVPAWQAPSPVPLLVYQSCAATSKQSAARTRPVSLHWMRSSVPYVNRRAVGASRAPGRRSPAACSARDSSCSRWPQYSSASCIRQWEWAWHGKQLLS